jgi:hypothetical protein
LLGSTVFSITGASLVRNIIGIGQGNPNYALFGAVDSSIPHTWPDARSAGLLNLMTGRSIEVVERKCDGRFADRDHKGLQ